MGRIVVIGWNEGNDDDWFFLLRIATFLKEHQLDVFANRIAARDLDVYDMLTRPERGDALDHINNDVDLVIALFVYGVDKPSAVIIGQDRHYNVRNWELAPLCARLKIPLVAWGDQPDLSYIRSFRKITKLSGNISLVLYEP
ncbi:MAG TPA: hypothetical protein VFG19_08165 [Geobacteraceae bacterium]|nr:hypothetical protein [Geobacteraceae bacterium]